MWFSINKFYILAVEDTHALVLVTPHFQYLKRT